MLRAASSAPNLLREASERVVAFLRGQLNEDGGGKDRAGCSDLYYTVFVLDGLAALRADRPDDATLAYLRSFDTGGTLDLVHLACLARCWAAMPTGSLRAETAAEILRNVEAHRCADGGYASTAGDRGTVYDCFLALGACQDLGSRSPEAERIGDCLKAARTADGAFANAARLKSGTTSATAAAVLVLRELQLPVPDGVAEWLSARCSERGGFRAAPNSPAPDLLSTATALHALAALEFPFAEHRESCLDFVDTLWTGRAFHGHWADDAEDAEYAFYALLALGHLS